MRKIFSASTLFIPAVLLTFTFSDVSHAQKIVDPSTVAPEFREAAEKRRAEQLKQIACNRAAHEQKIAPREVLKFVTDCFDKPDDKSSDMSAAMRPATPASTPK